MLKIILENIFQMYYIVIICAVLISLICINMLEKLSNINRLYLISSYTFSILGMTIGSKTVSLIENILFSNGNLSILYSGFSFMGGVLGYLISIKLYSKIYKCFPKEIINNLLTLAVPLIYGISKIGCTFASCCAGINNIPIQIIESITYIIIFLFCSILYKTKLNKDNVASISLIIMCVARIIADCFRFERNTIFINITISQLLCVIIILVYLTRIKKQKQEQKQIKNYHF